MIANPLLKEPLKLSHVKPLAVGHWGTTPGQNFIYVHLNRVIKKYDLNMFHIAGPGHGGPAIVGNVYLESTWSEVYPNVTQDEAGLKKLFKQFSFPGGVSSHVAPTTAMTQFYQELSMFESISQQILLKSYPTGVPKESGFAFRAKAE